jgi:hypothetical protein
MANTTWNPSDKTNCTLTGSNLIATTAAGGGGVRAVDAKTSGKYYFELTYTTLNTNTISCGISQSSGNLISPGTGTSFVIRLTGVIRVNGVNSGFSFGVSVPPATIFGIAVDLSGQLIWYRFAPSGNWNNDVSANPATGVNGASISSIAGSLYPFMSGSTSDKVTANFGDAAFAGAVPSGFTVGWPTGSGGATTVQARVMVLA